MTNTVLTTLNVQPRSFRGHNHAECAVPTYHFRI